MNLVILSTSFDSRVYHRVHLFRGWGEFRERKGYSRNSIVRTLLVSTLLLSLTLGMAFAEGASTPAPLSLRDCIGIAMKNQVDILTAQGNVVVAKSRVSQANSSYFPQVSIQNNTFHTGSGVLSKVSNGTALSVTQTVFDGGVREANAQGARYGVTQSNAGLTRTMQTVTFNVTQSYYEFLRAKHLAEVSEANVKYNEELLSQVNARAKYGAAAATDPLPVEAQLASARVNLLAARNTVRTSSVNLQNAMGLSPESGFDIQDVTSTPQVELRPLDTYVKVAEASRPDVAQRKAALGSAKASVRAAGISLYPRPTISGQYDRSIVGGFTTSSTQLVGGISFDLFDGGANRAAYRGARAGRTIAEQQAQQVVKDIRAQVEQAYLNLTSSGERMTAAGIGLAAARKNYEVQRERYDLGLGITLDLLNAEVQLVTAQSDDVQARYDNYTAVAQMDYAVGTQGGPNAR